ncbi:Ca-activated chloride channel family protein [Stenotrophomonas sp. 2619]|uniref:VIT domain-containing protein n=1 Tax=Stenotrophomonas sp. 2619 TaxID=3156316 RepID=UPI0033958FBC
MQRTLRGIGMLGMLLLGTQAGLAQARTAPRPPPVTPVLQVAGAEVPVQLRQVRLDSRVVAGLGETRIEMTFFNPNRRVLEGQLEFPLADGQQVAGFALDIDGVLRDAVPVPKAQGRQVFEAIERRRVDPGLLEQTAGNQFRLRVYPIPAHGSRRIVLTFRDTLPVDAQGLRWAMPLQFARGAEEVVLRMEARGTGAPTAIQPSPWKFGPEQGAYVAQWQGRGDALPAQVLWRLPLVRQPDVVTGLHEGQRYLLAQVPVPAQATPRVLPRRVGLVWDASGSARQRDRAAEFAVLDRYFGALGTGEVDLTVLRDRAEPSRRFRIQGGDWSALRTYLTGLPLDGASALGAWTPRADVGEYLLVSDGLSNYGTPAPPALASGQRLYALSSAGARTDGARLRAWTGAHHGQTLVLSSAAEVEAVLPLLLQQPAQVVALRGTGVDQLVADASAASQGWVRVSGRVQRADGVVEVQVRLADGRDHTQRIPLAGSRALDGGLVAQAWASATLAGYAADPVGNAAVIGTLSQQFGMVGADTSLLVLETLGDYLRHGIRAPAPLRADYDRLHAVRIDDEQQARARRLDQIAAQFAERERWWNTRWPKGTPATQPVLTKAAPMAAPMAVAAADATVYMEARANDVVAPPSPPAPPAPMALDAAPQGNLEAVAGAGSKRSRSANSGAIAVTLAAWEPDSAYARRLRGAAPAQLYALYLAEREQHSDSSAFYLDVADLLLAAGQRELGLRVLSNLAEMQLDNRHVLRVLGYRLMQANAPDLAVPVFRQVLRLGEEEPQSFRDLGLALEASGQYQPALDALNEVVVRPWDSRFDGISLIALDELNTLAARERVDARAVDPRLRRALPLDLRVVLSWDSDNSDMDLWVTDPNGERAYYGNRLTYQGGQMSQDFTGGYGPEQFSLRDAKPGKYKVEANFFGSREQLVTGATTLSLRLSTHWGTGKQRDQQVTMRLKDRADTVLVGEFEVR